MIGEFIVKNRFKFFVFSAISMVLVVLAVLSFGLKLSIEFTGGELFEIASAKKIEKNSVAQSLEKLGLSGFSVRPVSVEGYKSAYLIRVKPLEKDVKNKLTESFKKESFEILRSSFVGPSIGAELKKKALVAIALTILAIIIFVAWAFREVSKPVSSWYYGLVAILALVHDIAIPVGVFAVMGKFFGAEVDVLFVMALLAILGYSVNDTIVIFDRIRERLKENKVKKIKESFEESVAKALQSTIGRSINTSLTTALVLFALVFIGSDVTKYFALTLLAGVIAGTYSSIFLAAPILVELQKRIKTKENGEDK